MVDDLLLNRAAAVERALLRVRELHAGDDAAFDNRTRAEAIMLSLQRACESSIDAAMHLVRVHRLGIPQETREAFDMIERAGFIDPQLATNLRAWVAFRTLLLHDDQNVAPADLRRMVVHHLAELQDFTERMLRRALDAGEHR